MDKVFIIAQQEDAHTNAIETGILLARAMKKDAEVFAYCYEDFSGGERYNPRLKGAARQQLLQQRELEVRRHLTALDADDIPLHLVWAKYLFEHACDYSQRHGFDYMVKAVHHAEHYQPHDWHLIRHVQIPLLLLTDTPLHRGNATLIAVDLDSHAPLKQQLNQAVIHQGQLLAKATDTQLHLAHVIRVPKMIRDMDLINTRTLAKEAHQRHQLQLSNLGLGPDDVHMLVGEPDLCLYELACRIKSRYLVIGCRQRQGLLGHMIGNTVESLLSRIRSNVLVIPAVESLL
ncbi:universal stress protein [Shewanella salipaludis]|uniref:Universal stress protein n=1 Tax=Shewanella salipaludis TaxID=2723052 RepID=A0A972G0R9_9GAMM|nr:universal stress protein [Shewanella salipaludis]NMH66197.1 universal stress protein [Shewanella salipaludis]